MSAIRIVSWSILLGVMFAFQTTIEDEIRTPMDPWHPNRKLKGAPRIYVPLATVNADDEFKTEIESPTPNESPNPEEIAHKTKDNAAIKSIEDTDSAEAIGSEESTSSTEDTDASASTDFDEDTNSQETVYIRKAVPASANNNEDTTPKVDPKPGSKANAIPGQRLRVEVYYEVLCPECKHFIRNQLNLVMMDNHLLEYTDLVFVPYGKVSAWKNPMTRNTTLYCQHGVKECELNALHACLVENNLVEEQMKMINCLMGSTNSADECASLLNIEIKPAQRCKANRSTADILSVYGEKTNALDITTVPTVIIDGVFNRSEQRQILYDFMSAFCAIYTAKFGTYLEKCQV